MPATIVTLFAHYGYLVIFGAILLENAGVPSPGHTVMLAAGALAQQRHLSLPLVIAVGVVAAVLGDNVGYLIGRQGGRALLLKHGRRFLLTPESLAKAETFFDKHGAKTVFIGRFITGLQTVVALLAGANRMRWRNFFVWNVMGALVWASIYAGLGYAFGASWGVLEQWVGHAGLFLLALLGIGVAAWGLRHRKRLGQQFERLLPAAFSKRQAALGLVVLGSAVLFAKIAEDVVARESTPFDRAVSIAVHSIDTPTLDIVMRAFTFIGSFPVVAAVTTAMLLWCRQRKDMSAFTGLLGIVALDEGLNFILKQSFARARPTLFEEIATLHSYSFPSGHAMAAASIYGMIAVVVGRFKSGLRVLAWVIASVLALLIGLSRIYLGAHWITDVLAGFAAGSTLLFAGVLWLELCQSEWWQRSHS